MIEITAKGKITAETLVFTTPEEMEQTLTQDIAKGIAKGVIEKIDDMPFVNMEQNPSTQDMEWKADLIVCSKEQVVSSVGIMAQRLVEKFDATPEQIEYCLESAVSDLKGW